MPPIIKRRPNGIPLSAPRASERFAFSLFGMMVALTGSACAQQTNIVGMIFWGELALPVCAVCGLFLPGKRITSRDSLFAKMFALSVISLLGFVMSDLIRGSNPDQYLRGWGRNILIASDFASLMILARKDRQFLWWFVAGFGIGGILYLRLRFHAPLALWKFDENHDRGYGLYVVMATAAFSRFVPTPVAALAFLVLAYKSFFWDYRSLAALCTVIAGILWARRNENKAWAFGRTNLFRYAVVALLAAGAVYGGLHINDDRSRRDLSDAGRVFMWNWAFRAIVRSPIFGYGSWANSKELFTIQAEVAKEERGITDNVDDVSGSAGGVHSELLGSWVEGGIFGASFFIYLAYQLLRLGPKGVLHRPLDSLTPIIVFIWIDELLDLAAAPIGAPSRIFVAIAATAVVLVNREAVDAKRRFRTATLVAKKESNDGKSNRPSTKPRPYS